MEVQVCKNCKRLFNHIYGPELCPECIKLTSKDELTKFVQDKIIKLKPALKQEEEKYEQVRDYIILHPKATIVNIAEENGVSPLKLLDWIREDRFEFSEDSKDAWFQCVSCGTKIKSGRYCNICKIR